MKRILWLLALLPWTCLQAGTLTIDWPLYAGKQAVITVMKDLSCDTLGGIVLDKNGKGSVTCPERLPMPGIGMLIFPEQPDVKIQFIISPTENARIQGTSSKEYHVTNSRENECLDRWFMQLLRLKQKLGLNHELSKRYERNDQFYHQLYAETKRVATHLKVLQDSINNSSLFAAKYINYRVAREEILRDAAGNHEERTIARNYFRNDIDFETLYNSGLWQEIINRCLAAYVQEGDYYGQFGPDVVMQLKRIKSQEVYTALADAAITITETFAWTSDQKIITDFLLTDKRLQQPSGKLAKLVDLQKNQEGSRASDLVVNETVGQPESQVPAISVLKSNELSKQYSLLFFYRSDCDHCIDVLHKIKARYDELKNKGFRVISVSADTEQQEFERTAAISPWPDKLYDRNGFDGVNFRNYAVLGTPTLYVLDHNGIIRSKPATAEALFTWLQQQAVSGQ